MHRALFIEEILYVIFLHCYPKPCFAFLQEQSNSALDLVALASTCRAFKEPALDVLWTELKDITPLARCLPEVCFLKGTIRGQPTYSFKRRLKEAERETVKRYTRRVRALSINYHCPCHIDRESLADLCLPSIAYPLFPNIRRLHFYLVDKILPLIHHIAVPSLTWLHLHFAVSNISSCESLVRSLGPGCPNMKRLQITSSLRLGALDETINRQICHWTRLQQVDCSRASLDIDTLVHLSRMPDLVALSFMLSQELLDQIASSNHLLVFSALKKLQITIESIVPIPISKLFTRIQLPAVSTIHTFFHVTSPSKHAIMSFLMALQESCTGQTAMYLHISHITAPALVTLVDQSLEHSTLTFEGIHDVTALNLTGLHIDLNWIVDLKDGDLLAIASLCQQLLSLVINDSHGWRAAGITPVGLTRFFQQCPSICQLCIALDTRDYTSPLQIQTSEGNPASNLNTINLTDSVIEAESVPALAVFFADSFPQLARGQLYFSSWGSPILRHRHQDWEVYMKRWQDVYRLAKQKLLGESQRSAGRKLLCLESSGES